MITTHMLRTALVALPVSCLGVLTGQAPVAAQDEWCEPAVVSDCDAALSGPPVPAATSDGRRSDVPADMSIGQYVTWLDFGCRLVPDGVTIAQHLNRLDFDRPRRA